MLPLVTLHWHCVARKGARYPVFESTAKRDNNQWEPGAAPLSSACDGANHRLIVKWHRKNALPRYCWPDHWRPVVVQPCEGSALPKFDAWQMRRVNEIAALRALSYFCALRAAARIGLDMHDIGPIGVAFGAARAGRIVRLHQRAEPGAGDRIDVLPLPEVACRRWAGREYRKHNYSRGKRRSHNPRFPCPPSGGVREHYPVLWARATSAWWLRSCLIRWAVAE